MAIKDLKYIDNLNAIKLQQEKEKQMAEGIKSLVRLGLGKLGIGAPKQQVAGVNDVTGLPSNI